MSNFNQQYPVYLRAIELTRQNNREEGGWVYQNTKTGRLMSVLKNRDTQWDFGDGADTIVLANPPKKLGWRVVATFHVHRGSVAEASPSGTRTDLGNGLVSLSGDLAVNEIQKVPGLVLAQGRSDPGPAWSAYGPLKGVFNVGIPQGCD